MEGNANEMRNRYAKVNSPSHGGRDLFLLKCVNKFELHWFIVLGLRSTTDPLFQIDKVFNKVKNMDLDSDQLERFFEAAEDWNSAMNMSNSMAFISQFGEYNPGGGKDEVLKYLNESKKQVEMASKSLKTIMDCLGIE